MESTLFLSQNPNPSSLSYRRNTPPHETIQNGTIHASATASCCPLFDSASMNDWKSTSASCPDMFANTEREDPELSNPYKSPLLFTYPLEVGSTTHETTVTQLPSSSMSRLCCLSIPGFMPSSLRFLPMESSFTCSLSTMHAFTVQSGNHVCMMSRERCSLDELGLTYSTSVMKE